MRTLALALVAVVLAGLAAVTPAGAPIAAAAGPKVAIIVGATHSSTARYRDYANQIAATASKYTTNVVKVYSPNATWSKVKSAVNGAAIVVYLGHGNGWPSPYTYDANYTTKDGFGLNYDVNGDGKLSDNEVKYYGEPSIRTLTPQKNAVVLLFHLCYASGNSEPGDPEPTLTTARKRVDNYAAAFIQAGARAVLANGHSHSPYYIDALFTTRQTMDDYFRNAPDAHDNVRTYDSTRNPGYSYQLDPEGEGRYYRSIAGRLTLTTTQVTGASYASTSLDPATFVVPGNATPVWDGAPVYGSAEGAAQGVGAVATLTTADRVRLEAKEWITAGDGSAVFRVHTDGGVQGWMTGTALVPRDSAAPKLWGADGGAGVFSPNDDGRQDTWTLAVELSEAASWTLRVLDGSGTRLASSTGDGNTASLTWAPAAGSVTDGTYRWEIEAVDGWGNGPLEDGGTVKVDLTAPELGLGEAEGPEVPSFAPNGDGYRETFSVSGTSNEAGWLVASVRNAAVERVASLSNQLASGGATLTWDGTGASGFVPDGRYTIRVQAKDIAGNLSEAQIREVDVYAALGHVQSSRTVFFPQDGDALAKTTTFSMVLRTPQTVTWRVIDAAGRTVRTLAADTPYAAGTWKRSWDGRNDAGAFVPRGTYRTDVRVTDGEHVASQRASVVADAFRFIVSDTTPGDRQRITVTIKTPETMARNPRIAFYQPGIAGWSVATRKISSTTYRATVTLRASRAGTLKIKAYGTDSRGGTQRSYLRLPIH